MSTKAIEEVLRWAAQGNPHPDVEAAKEELMAIRRVAVTLAIRTTEEIRADGMPNAAALIERIAKESK